MLGPVRFTHIETCAREVCKSFKIIDEVEECILELKRLDVDLANLRAELSAILPPTVPQEVSSSPSKPKSTNYEEQLLSPPDVARANRLVNARQHAIRSVRGLLEKRRAEDRED